MGLVGLEMCIWFRVLEGAQSAERDTPYDLEVDHGKMPAEFIRTPAFSDVPYAAHMEPNLVIEYYSRS